MIKTFSWRWILGNQPVAVIDVSLDTEMNCVFCRSGPALYNQTQADREDRRRHQNEVDRSSDQNRERSDHIRMERVPGNNLF
jgi:hypothetical protein